MWLSPWPPLPRPSSFSVWLSLHLVSVSSHILTDSSSPPSVRAQLAHSHGWWRRPYERDCFQARRCDKRGPTRGGGRPEGLVTMESHSHPWAWREGAATSGLCFPLEGTDEQEHWCPEKGSSHCHPTVSWQESWGANHSSPTSSCFPLPACSPSPGRKAEGGGDRR